MQLPTLISFSTLKSLIKGIKTILLYHFQSNSKPTHQNDPVSEFWPVKKDEVHYLDVTNRGLLTGIAPNKDAFELWASIEQRAMKLSRKSLNGKRDEL